MREMAKIVTIKELFPIPDKQRIQVAKFEEHDYEAIVGIDFNVGDLVVWIEADSILPDEPVWRNQPMVARSWKETYQGFLIKAIKMNGIKSWGLVSGLEILPEGKWKAGQDVTLPLNIRKLEDMGEEDTHVEPKNKIVKYFMRFKWFRDLYGRSVVRYKFPTDIISKSDESNLKNLSQMYERNINVAGYMSVKLEGMSATYVVKKKKLICCGRNQAFKLTKVGGNAYQQMARQYDILNKLNLIKKQEKLDLALQGEICGPGVQKNIYKLKEKQYFVYKMVDAKTKKCLPIEEQIRIANEYGFNYVPILCNFDRLGEFVKDDLYNYASRCCFKFEGEGEFSNVETFILNKNDAMTMTDNVYSVNPLSKSETKKMFKDYFQHEGIVVRGNNYEFSFKVKNHEYAEWF